MLKTAIATVITLSVGFALITAQDGQSAQSGSRDRLEDAWELHIHVDEAGVGGVMPNRRDYVGAVALLQVATEGARPWMTVSGFSYAGVFSDSFQAVGVAPTVSERIPLAAAKMLGADSVEVVLNPTRDHGAMVLKGVLNGKRVTGRWEVSGYVPGAKGTFEMTPLE